jgi:hypothetical protein
MPPAAGNDFLTTQRINEIRKDIMDVRTIPGELLFLRSLNQNPKPNRWLTAKWKGNLQIADLIAPNSPGVAYKASRVYTEGKNLQNMKVGTVWSADEVEEYYEIKAAVSSDPNGVFAQGLFRQAVMDQIVGTEWRMEWLAVAMATDGYYGTSSYNRLGFSLTSSDGRTPTWGMKPDMKSFIEVPLFNTDGTVNAACKIITYIYNMIELRRQRYGKETNRLRMRNAVKRAIQQTDEFKALAAYSMPNYLSFSNISPADFPRLDALLAEVLSGSNRDRDLSVQTYDAVYQTENGDGKPSIYVPFLPLTPEACIILDDRRNDNNDSMHDFGIGTTMESRAEPMRYSNGIPDDLPPGQNGIFSYLDMPTHLNPVSFGVWTTARAWPQKNDEVCESVLFVGGPGTDPVPVTDIAIV